MWDRFAVHEWRSGIERIISLFYLFIYFVLFLFFVVVFSPSFIVSRFCNYIKILTCIILCWLDFFSFSGISSEILALFFCMPLEGLLFLVL